MIHLISVDQDNEKEVIDLMSKYEKKINMREMVNRVYFTGALEETMLMWAVWRLKKNIVNTLLEFGANVRYVTRLGQGASTYWDLDAINRKEKTACEITEILHKKWS